MILSADYIIDVGPGAGKHGGKIVAAGTPEEMLKCNTLTCQYLTGELKYLCLKPKAWQMARTHR
jgi:excinuclease ABC subunit A